VKSFVSPVVSERHAIAALRALKQERACRLIDRIGAPRYFYAAGFTPTGWRINVIKATELRVGKVVVLEGKLVRITNFEHITPGNWRGIVQIKFKDLMTGIGSQRRINPDDKFEEAYLETKPMQYLYKQGDKFVFMDQETFEQPEIPEDIVGEASNYLRENDEAKICFYEGRPVSLELPASVVLTITASEPGIRGNSVSNVFKPATLETGLQIKVPNHINQGDKVKVDTRTGEFMERVNS